MGSVWTRYRNDEVTLVATKEEQIYRYYGTAEAYIENIFQYITTETYRKVNRVEVLGEENFEQADGYKVHVRKMHLMECDDTVKILLHLCDCAQWGQPLRTADVQGGG